MLMLASQYAGDDDTRIVEEMGVWSGSVRIDIAVINGMLSGYELKSESDTLDRLPSQIGLYSKVFDQVVLVVGEKHAPRALQAIPDWWGAMVASQMAGSVALASVRVAMQNPAPDRRILARLLWKEEALKVLESRGLARGYRRKPVPVIHDRLAGVLTYHELSFEVRTALKVRLQWLGQPVADQREMAVHANLDPLRSAA